MIIRLTVVFLAFSVLVPAAGLPVLAAIFPTGWAELASKTLWWPGVVYAITSMFTIKSARGPLSLLVSTWFFGSAAVIAIGTASWFLTVVDWHYAPVVFLGYAALPALPGLLLAALAGAWIARLPSVLSEFSWFWSGKP